MIYLPDREIVTPDRCDRCGGWQRAGVRPFWRGGVRAMNTAGKYQRRAAAGKCQRNVVNGKLMRNTALNTICCCNCCVPSWDATITGVNLATTCVFSPLASRAAIILGASTFGGTFTLTHVGNCQWSYTTNTLPFQAAFNCGGPGTMVQLAVVFKLLGASRFEFYAQMTSSGGIEFVLLFYIGNATCPAGIGTTASEITAYSVVETAPFATLGKDGTGSIVPTP